MASMHAVETVMNLIIGPDGDPMYRNIERSDIDNFEAYRFIRQEHIEMWAGNLEGNRWFGVPSVNVINQAIAEAETGESFSDGDKAAMSDRIARCVKYRLEKATGKTVEWKTHTNGDLLFRLA